MFLAQPHFFCSTPPFPLYSPVFASSHGRSNHRSCVVSGRGGRKGVGNQAPFTHAVETDQPAPFLVGWLSFNESSKPDATTLIARTESVPDPWRTTVYAPRAVRFRPDGGQFDFARSSARTPWGVRVNEPAKSGKIPTRIVLRLLFASRPYPGGAGAGVDTNAAAAAKPAKKKAAVVGEEWC